jgi:cytochrome c2
MNDLAKLRAAAEEAMQSNDGSVKRAAAKLALALLENSSRPLLVALVADYLARLWRGAGRSICAVVLAAVGVAHADGDLIRGEQHYADCIACHSLERDIHGVGPSLHGVFGRQAGELADFRYSPALKRSGIIWTAETMDAFIADPQRFVPLNRMPYDGMPNDADRADLIAYLRKASQ